MDYDGYQLHELLKDGAETNISHRGSTYTLRFIGEKTGSDNYLLVRDSRGQERRFGWGCSSEQVWQALEQLERGWDTPQVPRYRPYNSAAETEGGGAYRYD